MSGNASIEVGSEGVRVGSTSIPYGAPFAVSSTASPPMDEIPPEHAQACRGADQAWSIDMDVGP